MGHTRLPHGEPEQVGAGEDEHGAGNRQTFAVEARQYVVEQQQPCKRIEKGSNPHGRHIGCRIPVGVAANKLFVGMRGQEERKLQSGYTIGVLVYKIPGWRVQPFTPQFRKVEPDTVVELMIFGQPVQRLQIVIDEGGRQIHVVAHGIAIEGIGLFAIKREEPRAEQQRDANHKPTEHTVHRLAKLRL